MVEHFHALNDCSWPYSACQRRQPNSLGIFASPPSLGEQFIQRVHDAVAIFAQGDYKFAEMLVWNRHNFQRMQDHLDLLDFEGRIESWIAYFPERRLSHHRHNHSATVAVI